MVLSFTVTESGHPAPAHLASSSTEPLICSLGHFNVPRYPALQVGPATIQTRCHTVNSVEMGSDQPSANPVSHRWRNRAERLHGAADLGKQDVFITAKQAPRKLCTLEHSTAAHASGRLPATVPGIAVKPWVYQLPGWGEVDSQNMAVRDGHSGRGAKETRYDSISI